MGSLAQFPDSLNQPLIQLKRKFGYFENLHFSYGLKFFNE